VAFFVTIIYNRCMTQIRTNEIFDTMQEVMYLIDWARAFARQEKLILMYNIANMEGEKYRLEFKLVNYGKARRAPGA